MAIENSTCLFLFQESKWQQKLLDSLEQQRSEKDNLDSSWQHKEEKWMESRKSLEEQIHSLQNEIRDQEAMARSKNKGDLQLQVRFCSLVLFSILDKV